MIDSSKPLRILIVEDNTVCMKLLEAMLHQSPSLVSETFSADCLGSAIKILSQENIDLVLLDLNLPDSNGLDTLTKVHRLFGHIPIIVITGDYDDALGREVVMNGAQDYLIKGMYSAYTLTKSIHYAVDRHTMFNQLRELERRFGDEEVIQEIVNAWLIDNPDRISALFEAIKASNVEEVQGM